MLHALFFISLLGNGFWWSFWTGSFLFGGQKNSSLFASDRWSSYTGKIAQELAWADSALVVLDEWKSYSDGRLSRLDYTLLYLIIGGGGGGSKFN